ncbi:hypothetical protein [Pontibacter populi]|uniref:Uncharacterized protein n=1 Tax=Pontibacter populi TaxID=890055 RepID=A0ABV1RPW3_9BACT
MLKTKWLIWSVLIGLIPFIVRTFIWLFSKSATPSFWINESDFVSFGLVLSLANINELERKKNKDETWKSISSGISVFFIMVFSTIYGLVTYSDLRGDNDLDRVAIKICSVILALVSAIVSSSIYSRMNAKKP